MAEAITVLVILFFWWFISWLTLYLFRVPFPELWAILGGFIGLVLTMVGAGLSIPDPNEDEEKRRRREKMRNWYFVWLATMLAAIVLVFTSAPTGTGFFINFLLTLALSALVTAAIYGFDRIMGEVQRRRREAEEDRNREEERIRGQAREAEEEWRRRREMERQAQGRKRQPAQPVRDQRPPAPRGNEPFDITDLRLVIEDYGQRKTVSRFVQRTTIKTIRPLAVIWVFDQRYVSRILPLQFELVDPEGKIRMSFDVSHKLVDGRNLVAPSTFFPISPRLRRGRWEIRVWLANKISWAQVGFTVSDNAADQAGQIGADMEVSKTEEDMQVNKGDLTGIGLDDLG